MSATTTYSRPRSSTAAITWVERLEAHLVLASMTLLSAVMWIAVPLLWLQAAAAIGGDHPTPSDFGLVFVGLAVSVAVLAKVLSHLNSLHCELIGKPLKRMPRAWLHSYCERRGPCARTALDTIQELCAVGAILAFVVWYVAFDGRSIFT